MPRSKGLIPVVRIAASHRVVVNAVEAMLAVKDIDIDEENVSIDERGRELCVVYIDGEEEDEIAIASASGYLKGWCDRGNIEADIP